jgi:hypothetical protein
MDAIMIRCRIRSSSPLWYVSVLSLSFVSVSVCFTSCALSLVSTRLTCTDVRRHPTSWLGVPEGMPAGDNYLHFT